MFRVILTEERKERRRSLDYLEWKSNKYIMMYKKNIITIITTQRWVVKP